MGILALIPYSVVKELCDSVKRDKKSFVGKIKNKKRKYERTPYPYKKVNHVKRLLVSAERKRGKAENESQKRTTVQKTKDESKDQSDEGDSGGSTSESNDSSDSSSDTESANTDSEIDRNTNKSDE